MAASVCRRYARTRLLTDISRAVLLLNRNLATKHEETTTHFGYEQVTEEEKSNRVYGVFESVSSNYDIMNDMMSLGIHRLWKDKFVQELNPMPGTKLLDVAGGTGDIAYRFLDRVNRRKKHRIEEQSEVVVCDINKNMLNEGEKRARKAGITQGISWVVGNAEELPIADSSFDAYTIAFGIRNVTNIPKALQDAHRILKPGGRFLCLEFTQVQNPVFQKVYDLYSFQVIPVLGEVIAGDWKSYQYLVESIRQFPDQETFCGMIEDAGFKMVTYENLTNGVVAIHSGFKL